MRKNNSLVTIGQNGELMYNGLNSHLGRKYQADTPLVKSFVPYLVMLFCATADASVFISLFQMITFDNPFLIGVEVSGFLFAFDVVPLYLGIQLRRLKQGLTKDRFIMWLALAVCLTAVLMNTALRVTTIDQMSPDPSDDPASTFGKLEETEATGDVADVVVEEDADADAGADPTAIAVTLFGIGLPVLTSAGSFFISYLIYNPLKFRKRTEEALLAEKKDEIRRFAAILSEYDADEEIAAHLVEDDEGKFEEMKKTQRALVLSYCEYVRQRLKEHLANPTATNALSEETCVAILERLDQELAALEKAEGPRVYVSSSPKTNLSSGEGAA